MMYIRVLEPTISTLARQFRVLTLLGPRQAGKSTLCRKAFPEHAYVSLEDPDARAFAANDPRGFLKTYPKNVILDEVQRVPTLLSYIQGIVDASNEKAQFVLTGSHQLELGQAVSQSLAGRTVVLNLLPLSFEELPRGRRTLDECMFEGFMPGRHADEVDVRAYYRSYFQTYVERDVRLIAQLKDLGAFEKFVRLCAGRVGQLLNVSSLATDAGISPHTAEHWLSILEASFLVMRLRPFHENLGKRLTKSAKLYFVETGLLVWLLGIENPSQLSRDPLRCLVFENMIAMDALKARLNRGLEHALSFYRDSHGNEVDLVVGSGRRVRAIEIKSAQTWDASFLRGLDSFGAAAGDRVETRTVVFGGDEARRMSACDLVPFDSIAPIVT